MYAVDIDFTTNSRPRNKLNHVGSAGGWYATRPALKYLREYEAVALYDTTVKSALNILLDAVTASLGDIEHPDEDIQNYMRYTIERMLDVHGVDLHLLLKRAIKTALWGGFSHSEVLYDVDDNKLFVKDVVNYHPSTVVIRPNAKGRLTENEPTGDGRRSGIYQTSANQIEVQIPIWKSCLLIHDLEFSNYYGRSLMEAIYRWHVLKEAIVDMMTVALDRFGNPIVAITLTPSPSQQVEVDAETGEERQLTTQEVLERQVQGTGYGQGNVLFLPQFDPAMKPDVKVLTTGNNVGSSFLDAINFCDIQLVRGLLVPYGLIDTTATEMSGSMERHMEIYNRIVKTIYKTFVCPFITQVFGRLTKFNFNRSTAKIAPKLPLRSNTRPQDSVALMQLISGLTNQGYFNPTNSVDWAMVREMVAAMDRPQDKKDIEFVKQLLVYPRQKTEGGNPERDRSSEGEVNGTGKRGRPPGTSAPQMVPRTPAA